jgi:hypothetical protein
MGALRYYRGTDVVSLAPQRQLSATTSDQAEND